MAYSEFIESIHENKYAYSVLVLFYAIVVIYEVRKYSSRRIKKEKKLLDMKLLYTNQIEMGNIYVEMYNELKKLLKLLTFWTIIIFDGCTSFIAIILIVMFEFIPIRNAYKYRSK